MNKKIITSVIAAVSILIQSALPAFALDEPYDTIKWRNLEYDLKTSDKAALEIKNPPVEYVPEKKYCTSMSWNIAPVIYKTSNAVKPGGTFYLYGEGIINKNLKLAAAVSVSAKPEKTPTEDAVYIDILQIDDDGKFLNAVLPEDMPSGTYDIWVGNDYGWSEPIRLNEAMPKFFQDYEMAQSMMATLYGQNMDAAEFGGETATKIVIQNEEHIYDMPVYSVNPFRVEFWISDNVAPGDYTVYISNDNGVTWAKQDFNYNEVLKISKKTEDPFKIGLGWANKFVYDTVLNVKDFGAVGDGIADDYPAIQAALEKVYELGGGIVYMPNGTYRINGNIKLHEGTILSGESEADTKILYAYDGSNKTSVCAVSQYNNDTTPGRIGLANFTFENDDTVPDYPDCFFWLGNGWGAVNDPDTRTAEYIFAKNIFLKYPAIKKYPNGRGLGFLYMGREHMYFDGIKGYGEGASFVHSYARFVTITNCDWYTSASYLCTISTFLTISNNYIYRFGEQYYLAGAGHEGKKTNIQGIFARGPSYIAHNSINHTDMLGDNDGEVICSECAGEGTQLYGAVKESTENTIVFEGIKPDEAVAKSLGVTDTEIDYNKKVFKNIKPYWGEYMVVITHGRGMGQYRYIDNIDMDSMTITLKKEWDVLPDITSTFVIMAPSDNCIIYDNTSYQGGKGYWLFGDTIDCVIADNIGVEMEGVFIWSAMNIGLNQYNLNYYDRVDRNSFDKSSYTESHISAVSACTDVTWGYTRDVMMMYGINFRENTVTNANDAVQKGVSEAPKMSGINMVHSAANGFRGDKLHTIQKALLIEDCVVKNSLRGLGVGGYASDSLAGKNEAPITAYVLVKGGDYNDNPRTFETSAVNNLLVIGQ